MKLEFETATGASFTCFPEFGGRLGSVKLRSRNGFQEVIGQLANEAEAKKDPAFTNVPLFPFPNRLDRGRWQYQTHALQFPINDPANQCALHGFLFRQILKPKTIDNGIILTFLTDANFSYYPFDVEVRVHYRLPDSTSFEVVLEAMNYSDTPAPVALGWHPYFCLGESIDNLRLSIPESEEVLVDGRLLPTGKTRSEHFLAQESQLSTVTCDTCFYLKPNPVQRTTLTNTELGTALQIQQDGLFEYLHVFTPPHRRSIALEPVSANINAFAASEGVRWLEKGESMSGKIMVQLFTKT